MEKKEKQEKKLELKDCVAMEKGWDFIFSAFAKCILAALLPATLLATFLVLFQGLTGSVFTNEVIRGIVYSTFSIWLIVFLLIAIKWREPLVEYWQLKVVGYTAHYFYGEDGKTVETFIHYGRTDRAGEGGTRGDLYLYVPLGGWFRQPCIKYRGSKYEGGDWRLKMAASYQYVKKEDYHFLYLCDNHGGRFRASVKEILWVINQYPQSSIAGAIYLLRSWIEIERSRADGMTERFDHVVYAATKATAAITETSRFGHSTEGAEIRRKLTKAVIDALPAGDARIKPLQAALGAKVGRRQKAKNQSAAGASRA